MPLPRGSGGTGRTGSAAKQHRTESLVGSPGRWGGSSVHCHQPGAHPPLGCPPCAVDGMGGGAAPKGCLLWGAAFWASMMCVGVCVVWVGVVGV